MADWQKIKTEYLTTDTSYRKLAEKYGLDQATIARRAKKEDWVSERQRHADKTQAKILESDIEEKVDRAARIMTVADKLLLKVEQLTDMDDLMTSASLKNLSETLRNIKEAQMIRSDRDLLEQDARIAKLRKEAQKDDDGIREPVKVIIAGDLSDYSK